MLQGGFRELRRPLSVGTYQLPAGTRIWYCNLIMHLTGELAGLCVFDSPVHAPFSRLCVATCWPPFPAVAAIATGYACQGLAAPSTGPSHCKGQGSTNWIASEPCATRINPPPLPLPLQTPPAGMASPAPPFRPTWTGRTTSRAASARSGGWTRPRGRAAPCCSAAVCTPAQRAS